MSTTTVFAPALVDRIIGRRSALFDVAQVVGGASLVGLAAQLAVPLWPVPITGQTLAVLLVGSALGAARGAGALALYALAGALGVPWFSEASGGWQVVFGPTGGYIVGFIAAAAFAGYIAQRRGDRRFLPALGVLLLGSVLPFMFGLPWLALTLHLDAGAALHSGLYPFIPGGLIKAAIAASILTGVWAVIERHSESG